MNPKPQTHTKIPLYKNAFFWGALLFVAGLLAMSIGLDFRPSKVARWIGAAAHSPFAIPATLLIYTAASFFSVPQWMLHGGVVLAFGPIYGAAMAWAATMCSASFNFWLGRKLGAARVERYGGKLTGRIIGVVRKHGFWTSLAVRIVPTGPFIIVNMAAGVAGMRFISFFLGTGIGIIPKIATVAFFGEGIQSAMSGESPLYIAAIVAIILIWIGLVYLGSSRLKKRSAFAALAAQDEEQDTAQQVSGEKTQKVDK